MSEAKKAFVLVLGGPLDNNQRFYTGKQGINEVEPVSSSELVKAKFYEKVEEANYIRGAMHVLDRQVVVRSVSLLLMPVGWV